MKANEFYIVEDKDGNILNQDYIDEFMSEERWLDVKGFEGIYQISNYGNVKSLYKEIPSPNGGFRKQPEKILKPNQTSNGYYQVSLKRNGERKCVLVHRLVLINFLGRPITYDWTKIQINHLDECKTNNFLTNLSYCTPKENCNWATHNKRVKESRIGYKHSSLTKQKMSQSWQKLKGIPVNQYDLNNKFIKKWNCIRNVDKYYNKEMSPNIVKCCKGKLDSCYGFKWRYAEE